LTLLLYPVTILATWFREMGHGLCPTLLGGSFVSLSLFGTTLSTYGHSLPDAEKDAAEPLSAILQV
jgi:hypothetical protein